MPLTLATFAPGAIINATVIRAQLQAIETYVNEGSVAGDRGTDWLQSNHLYRPDFYGGSNPHTTLVSGESYFRMRPESDQIRSWWSYYLGAGSTSSAYYPIPGLNATIQIPENISTNAQHRVRMFASFYAYDFGGVDGNMDEDTYAGARFAVLANGSALTGASRPIYKGSSTSADQAYAFYPRKQISFLYDAAVNRGIHEFGIGIVPVNNGSDQTKHEVVCQGNLTVRYYCR